MLTHRDSNDVQPTDIGEKRMRDDVIVHPMSPGEHMGHAGIVLFEDRPRLLGEERILVAEKTMTQGAVIVCHTVELVRLHFLEVRNRLLRHMELRFAVLAAIEPLVLPHIQDVIFL